MPVLEHQVPWTVIGQKHKKLEYSKRKKGLTLHHCERPSIMIIDRSEVVNDFQEEKKRVRMLEKKIRSSMITIIGFLTSHFFHTINQLPCVEINQIFELMADGSIGVCDRKDTSMFDLSCLDQDKSSCARALSSWQKAAHAIITLHVRFFSSHALPFAMDLLQLQYLILQLSCQRHVCGDFQMKNKREGKLFYFVKYSFDLSLSSDAVRLRRFR